MLISKMDLIGLDLISKVGKESLPCKHDIMGVLPNNNKKAISILQNYNDVVVFSNLYYEKYKDIQIKDLNNYAEYCCNLKNCRCCNKWWTIKLFSRCILCW